MNDAPKYVFLFNKKFMTQLTKDTQTIKCSQILLPLITIKPQDNNQQNLFLNNIRFNTDTKESNLESFGNIKITAPQPNLTFINDSQQEAQIDFIHPNIILSN